MYELWERLQVLPDTIDGLYEHMLKKLDKSYLQDAVRYLRFMMGDYKEGSSTPLTLLDFVCAEEIHWDHILRNDQTYFESSDFYDTCQNHETRILTRCAGLIEIDEHQLDKLPGVTRQCSKSSSNDMPRHIEVKTSRETRNVSCYLREVNFIHRTVVDFLLFHHQAFFKESSWYSAANLALARGKLGLMCIVPIAISDVEASMGPVFLGGLIENVMAIVIRPDRLRDIGKTDQSSEDLAAQMVGYTYQLIKNVNASLNSPEHQWFESYMGTIYDKIPIVQLPFHDCPGFAAFFGCHSYVSRHISLHRYNYQNLDYLLQCTIIGLKLCRANLTDQRFVGQLTIIEDLLYQKANPNSCLPLQDTLGLDGIRDVSAWARFLEDDKLVASGFSTDDFAANQQRLEQYSQLVQLWFRVATSFLLCGANTNTSILSYQFCDLSETDYAYFAVEKSPISHLTSEPWLLTWMDAKSACILRPSIEALENLLRSHNALPRIRFRLIQYGSTLTTTPLERYEWQSLSRKQSDRLYEASLSSDHCAKVQACREIEVSLKVADTVKISRVMHTEAYKL